MTEETMMDEWQREMKEGPTLKVRGQRFAHDYKVFIVIWLLAIPMYVYMIAEFGELFARVFMLVLAILTVMKYFEVRHQYAEYNGIMALVADIRTKRK